MKTCIVNDIDGRAVQTVASGDIEAVRLEYADAPAMLALIASAEAKGTAEADIVRDDGETFRVKVIVRDADLIAMAEMLERHGERFTGDDADAMAQEWLDHGFTVGEADGWCEIGCWDAATAAILAIEGLTPDTASAAAQRLIDAEIADSQYTDGDPIYSACNCDTDFQAIIDAAAELDRETLQSS